jgi:DNA-directed RNA polymerase specialized sigma24 family protein
MFRGRRNKSYAAIRLLETELQAEVDLPKRAAAEESLARMRRRMATAMERMSRVGLAPTNLEISKVLGVPKGTVDSGLYWLKKKLAAVLDPDNLKSA